MPRVLKKIFKIIAWAIGALILLVVLAALLIQIPAVQLKLTRKAISFLEGKLGTPVSLEGIHIAFPKNLVVEGLYLEDQQGDTLLYAGKLSVNTDLWALTRREILLNRVTLEHSTAFVHRPPHDSAYNFTYILEAFAGDSTAVPDTLEQKGWNFSVSAVRLQDIRARYDDELMGNHAALTLGTFDLHMETVDLENNVYQAQDVLLDNTRVAFKQTKIPVVTERKEDKEDSAAAVILTLDQVKVRNTTMAYEQVPLGQQIELAVGDFELRAEKIDLPNRVIALDAVTLAETSARYHQLPPDTLLPAADAASTDENPEAPWAISLNKLDLSNNDIQYYDQTQTHERGTLDTDHLWLRALDLRARDIRVEGEDIHAHLAKLAFREQSGFTLKSLSARVEVNEKRAAIEDLLLLTGNSRLQANMVARYDALDDLSRSYPAARISADITDSFLDVRDILFFKPSLTDSLPINIPKDSRVRLHTSLRGTLSDLHVREFSLRTLSDTQLDLRGRISGLPEVSQLTVDLTVDKLHTTRGDAETLLPPAMLPDSIRLPERVDVKATYRGSLEKASFSTRVWSDAGSLDLEGGMNTDSASALRGIDATIIMKDLAVGRTLGKPDSVMGNLTMEGRLRAQGLTLQEMNGEFTASVNHFSYGGYDYRDLRMYGTIRDTTLSATATMDDENLAFALNAGYTFTEIPRYQVTLDVKNADFHALRLAQEPLRARGTLMVDLETADFRVLNGNVGIRKVAIFNGDKLYAVDSLLFASIDQEGHAEINIDSDLLEARLEGSINVFALPGVMREYFHTYYSVHDSLDVADPEPQHFRFSLSIKNTDVLTGLLVPDLTRLVPGEIRGEFDSEAKKLELHVLIAETQYANIGVDSLLLTARSDEDALRYELSANRILVDSMEVDGLVFGGTVANDSIRTHLNILDSADNKKYVLAGTFFRRENGFDLQLVPRGIVLNYQPWQVPPDNYMRIEHGQFIAHHIELMNRREKITVESTGEAGDPLVIGFRELNLEYLSSMIAEEKPLSGLVNGDVRLFRSKQNLTFTSDITVDDFHLRRVPWGDLAVRVEQQSGGRFDVDASLSGNQNNVTVRGSYSPDGLDLETRISAFQLTSLQPLVSNQLTNLDGTVSGQVAVKGTTQRPDIDGRIVLANTRFRSTFLNSAYFIARESITFVEEGIAFNDFDIADDNENTARLDGTILTRDYRDFTFDLSLSTDRFRLLNTTEDDNDLFYGKVDVEAFTRVTGTMATPIINMRIGLAEGSDLTYVVPQSEASVLQSEGIVKFVDKTFEGDPFMRKIGAEVADTVKSSFRGIDLTARIELSDRDNFTIVIDPVTQDQLTVRGNSTLTLKMDPTGDIQLAGRYEISEGTYNLSFYKFVKREFSIESGSTITWLGDPLNAEMDISALYAVETSPVDLFVHQLTGTDASQVNRYRERLPFQVYLHITGELLQPEIGFELGMPPNERNAIGGTVYARLQDINTRESDLNKQVFALLILKRFIADNPLESQGGGGLESTARRSVSKVLTEQLNRLSENIKGVELSFDIKSYEEYSTGEAHGQTELQLGVSKSLFNDRLVVKLSGNIDIEGQNTNRDATDYIGDLALEYKVTPDGRFRITGFRNSDYDMIDGELTETGAGFIYVKDYNALRELFKANAQN